MRLPSAGTRRGASRHEAARLRDAPDDQLRASVGAGAVPTGLPAETRQRAQGRVPRHALARLRTPLTAILGWAHMLLGRRLGADEDAARRAIEQNAQAQARLIDDLLDVSRIIAGKLRLESRRRGLSGVVGTPATRSPGRRGEGVALGRARRALPAVSAATARGCTGLLEPPVQRREVLARGRPVHVRRPAASTLVEVEGRRRRHRGGVSAARLQSLRRTRRGRAGTAGSGWASQLPGIWWSCTAEIPHGESPGARGAVHAEAADCRRAGVGLGQNEARRGDVMVRRRESASEQRERAADRMMLMTIEVASGK